MGLKTAGDDRERLKFERSFVTHTCKMLSFHPTHILRNSARSKMPGDSEIVHPSRKKKTETGFFLLFFQTSIFYGLLGLGCSVSMLSLSHFC